MYHVYQIKLKNSIGYIFRSVLTNNSTVYTEQRLALKGIHSNRYKVNER